MNRRARIHPVAVGQMRVFAALDRALSQPAALCAGVLANAVWVEPAVVSSVVEATLKRAEEDDPEK